MFHEQHYFPSCFKFTVFLKFIMLIHVNPKHFFLLYPIVWINQVSIPVLILYHGCFPNPCGFQSLEGSFPSSFWLALSCPSGHNSEKFPRLPYLKYLPPLPNKWLFFFFHITLLTSFVAFTFHFFRLFIIWFFPEMVGPLRSGTLSFLFTFVL